MFRTLLVSLLCLNVPVIAGASTLTLDVVVDPSLGTVSESSVVLNGTTFPAETWRQNVPVNSFSVANDDTVIVNTTFTNPLILSKLWQPNIEFFIGLTGILSSPVEIPGYQSATTFEFVDTEGGSVEQTFTQQGTVVSPPGGATGLGLGATPFFPIQSDTFLGVNAIRTEATFSDFDPAAPVEIDDLSYTATARFITTDGSIPEPPAVIPLPGAFLLLFSAFGALGLRKIILRA